MDFVVVRTKINTKEIVIFWLLCLGLEVTSLHKKKINEKKAHF
jgi:hypothetical protein